jgi:hypothetical protein
MDTTKTFIEEFVLSPGGAERFAKELQTRFFAPGFRKERSALNDGTNSSNLTVVQTNSTRTAVTKKMKILFGPTGQNRQRLLQSKQSAKSVSEWVKIVQGCLNEFLKDERISTDLLLFIPSDQDEATYELVATEWLVQNGDLSVRSLQTDQRGAPFAGMELSQAMSRGGHRKGGGALVLSLMDFCREFQDLLNSEIDKDYLASIYNNVCGEDCRDVDSQTLVKAIRQSEPLMRSLIKNRLFNGTLSAGGGSCQITVKPEHQDRFTNKVAAAHDHGILRQSSSNQVMRTSEFTSIPAGNKTPLTADTLGYAMWPRTEPMTEEKIEKWRNHIQTEIGKMDLPPNLKGNLRGVYIGISAVFYAAKSAGCAEELLPKAIFLERLREKLRKLLDDPPPPKEKNGEEVHDHREFSNLVLVETLISNVLAETAWIVCKRNWRAQPASLLARGDEDVGELPQYVATWSLGLYLSQSN